ncbi:MAG: SIMPL domain-containing protein [Candidatus Wildermuthbacteria bacterium]|nr:SIMPL domain-containing protein [Candidatus Wildermuthbacteria bacterium]
MMDSRIKNVLGISLIVALAVFAVAAGWSAYAYGKIRNASFINEFAVKSEATRSAIPDVARFSAGVTTEGKKDLGELQKENTEDMNAVLQYLKKEGVQEKDIKTTQYDVSPKYSYPPCSYDYSASPAEYVCPPPQITGYAVSQRVEVIVRDFANIGDIVGGVVEQGANTVSSLVFAVENPEALQNEARAEAIAKTKEKALMIAKAGGFKLGRIKYINEETPNTGYDYGYERAAMSTPVIQTGTQEIKVIVSVSYGIE